MSIEVVVLGMHRSGTSTVALILKRMGVNMGDEVLDISPDNPYGHGEDLDFLSLNERILSHLGGSWDFPPNIDSETEIGSQLDSELENLIRKKNCKNKIWGWKEPRTTILMQYYNKYLTNPRFVCVNRDSISVADSLKRRGRMPCIMGKYLHKYYNGKMNSFISKVEADKVLNIDFSRLHTDTEKVIKELCFLLEINPSTEMICSAKNVVKPLRKVRVEGDNVRKKHRIESYMLHPYKAFIQFCKRYMQTVKYILFSIKLRCSKWK